MSQNAARLVRLDDPEALADWHNTMSLLRAHDPVHWDEGVSAWIVTRYEDVKDGLYRRDLSARGPAAFLDLFGEADRKRFVELRDFFDGWMVFSNSPYHERVRSCVQRVLTPRAVERRRARVRDEARRLAAAACGRLVDLYAEFARPLAANVIGDLLEIPAESWQRFSILSDDLISFTSAPRPEAAKGDRALQSYYEMAEYVQIAAKELKARGRTENPIVAVEELGETAMVATFAQFLTGGCDPVAASIGNAIGSLLGHPSELRRLRDDADLIGPALEECLRFETPFTHVPKVAETETTVAGVRLPAGSRVRFMIAAANRDPEVFPDSDRFDVGRTPNPHLAFGVGPHYCIGAGLARIELDEALRVLAGPDSRWHLEGPPTWVPSFGVRSVSALPAQIAAA